MKKLFKSDNTLRVPDELPTRREGAVKITFTDSAITDIESVNPLGTAIDIDGHVRDGLNVTLTQGGETTLTLGTDTHGKAYTSAKNIKVNAPLEGRIFTANGSYLPSSGKIGMNGVTISVAPVQMTQAQYDALLIKDPNTVYVIKD